MLPGPLQPVAGVVFDPKGPLAVKEDELVSTRHYLHQRVTCRDDMEGESVG